MPRQKHYLQKGPRAGKAQRAKFREETPVTRQEEQDARPVVMIDWNE